MKTSAAKNIDEYLDELPDPNIRAMLERLRQTIRSVAPKAEEVISYQMPAFKYYGMLVYFSAFKNHCSLFPANSSLIPKLNRELKPFKTAKGTIQFTVEKPLPTALVKKIVKARMHENIARYKLKQLMESSARKTTKKVK
ncbi:MAG: DUF1801 domain-containing protein [Bacteroidia bacterium]|nr:DUF1801 domain-containing protein [Bacteroidia bacterium]